MLLEDKALYMVLNDVPGTPDRKIELFDSLDEAVSRWTPGSRVSPIWPVKGNCSLDVTIAGDQTLLFVGPVQPARLHAEIPGLAEAQKAHIWLSAGLFNIVMLVDLKDADAHFATDVAHWAQSSNLAYEIWQLSDGTIRSAAHETIQGPEIHPTINRLASLFKKHDHPALRPVFQENLIVTSTSLVRSAAVYPPLAHNLVAIAGEMADILEEFGKGALSLLEMQSRLLSMNAALSRFSSQAFSGTPPILGTECHFWIHSLLGTGSANLALANLAGSIQKILGEARLRERLEGLEKLVAGTPTVKELASGVDLLNFELLDYPIEEAVNQRPIIPLVTYFSGRDGFSSQLQTLSAPLTTLAECNSYRSNLATVTHEISHIFIQSALADLSPSLGDEKSLAWARALYRSNERPANHLSAARKLLIEAVVSMEMATRNVSKKDMERDLAIVFDKWRREVQEILVHSFDFLYFNQREPELYIKSIWNSWCAIPGINDRVPEYLMRTLCAVSANLLAEPPATRLRGALEHTNKILESIDPKNDLSNNYVSAALTLIGQLLTDSEQFKQFEQEYSARLYLVRLVRIYLYSDKLGAQLFQDRHIGRGGGYDTKKNLNYDLNPIGNALQFLNLQLKVNPSDTESLWVLHTLAFNLDNAVGRA